MDDLREIAFRIAELREACGFTRDGLADDLGIDRAVYAGYEENGQDIPISVLFRIAHKFGVDLTEILTGTAAKLDTYHIIKAGNGRSVKRYEGYKYQDLAFRYSHKIMQPLLVTLDPSDQPADLVSHGGQEFNMVIEGTMIFTFDGKDMILNKGDSVYFNPVHPHGQRCGGTEKTVFLTVIAE
jgi:transcriptional regulator with XRE-family HTH domain